MAEGSAEFRALQGVKNEDEYGSPYKCPASQRQNSPGFLLGAQTIFWIAHALGGLSLQEEVQSHRSKGLGDAVMWRREQSDD